MEVQKLSIPLERSNREFLGYINKSTKHIYMISEFIDNSLQSALDHNLNISMNIVVNMKEECIYIIDTAGGIKFDDIPKVMKNGNDNDEIGKNLNMFGVGMKMASIWFGKRLTIFSKSINENEAHKSVLDVERLPNNNFSIETQIGIDIKSELGFDIGEHGTIIKIDKLHLDDTYKNRYNEKMFFKKDKENWDSLEMQILFRFSRQIKKGRLVLSLSYLDKNGKERILDENKKPIILNTNSVIDFCINKNDFKYEEVNIKESKRFNYQEKFNEIKQIYADKMNQDLAFENLTYEDIFRKFDNQERFEFETYFRVEDDINPNLFEMVKFKFGYLKKETNLNQFFGLNVFQDDRAIVSGPNSKSANVNWLSHYRAFSNTYYNISLRFYGEIDLQNKKMFKVDNNKMGFQDGVKEKIEKIILEKFSGTNGLGDLFGQLLNLLEYNKNQKKEEQILQADAAEFAKELQDNNILKKHDISNMPLSLVLGNETEELPAYNIENKLDTKDKFIFVWRVNNFENTKQLFRVCTEKAPEYPNAPIFLIEVNRDFLGFSKTIKKEEFKILMNPITKLALMQLCSIESNEDRHTLLKEILEAFNNES